MKILSFDIEDWFNLLEHPSTDDINNWSKFDSRVKKSTDAILEVLNEYNISASFFILGWVAENQPEVVKKIHDSGHHIGTHSYAHKVAYSQSREEFEKDLKKSISLLEDLIGKKIDSYRAPGFSITAQNMWAYEVLHENGIIYDSSIFPSARYHGGFKNFPTKKPFKLNVNGETIWPKGLIDPSDNVVAHALINSGINHGTIRSLTMTKLANSTHKTRNEGARSAQEIQYTVKKATLTFNVKDSIKRIRIGSVTILKIVKILGKLFINY